MKHTVENDHDVIEFQTWLERSIRRAWILALAVAIPGAFLLTFWFPHSPQALLGVAILGIAIGVISDAVENAKKRRLQEIEQITTTVRQTVQELTRLIEEKIGEDIKAGRAGANVTVQQAEIEAIVYRAVSTNPLIIEEIQSVYRTLEGITEKLKYLPKLSTGPGAEEFLEALSQRESERLTIIRGIWGPHAPKNEP